MSFLQSVTRRSHLFPTEPVTKQRQLLLIIQIAYIILSGTKDFAAGEYEAFV